ncbi:hypothetical protein H6F46_08560 [Limnothrix sp. FACHB-1083]|uniref:hypothetical protein n=1 Tax=unclassified Limnothrix TaxID=2632864 RepID=UPI0016807772|nr:MULTISPECIES: hypothetical protein [unclassified Limnothrix]MBD2160745.1 hypothetical protein [Limnothrix sp. FACHB-1083]MBD2191411.1 hypothetical protein [Limnothrix sp. FACHB-1088]
MSSISNRSRIDRPVWRSIPRAIALPLAATSPSPLSWREDWPADQLIMVHLLPFWFLFWLVL